MKDLKQKGIKYACEYPTSYGKGYKRVDLRKAYIAGAESRQPEIDNLSKHILELQKDKGESVDENRKARKLLKEFLDFANLEIEYDPENPQEHTKMWNELCKKVEQFFRR